MLPVSLREVFYTKLLHLAVSYIPNWDNKHIIVCVLMVANCSVLNIQASYIIAL